MISSGLSIFARLCTDPNQHDQGGLEHSSVLLVKVPQITCTLICESSTPRVFPVMLAFCVGPPLVAEKLSRVLQVDGSRRGRIVRRQRVLPTARHVGAAPLGRVTIIQQGNGWIAIDKPANLLVHRNDKLAKGETRFVVDELRALLPDMPPEDVRVVHRLDRPTSGVMLFAVGDTACAAQLQASLQDHAATRKEYWALARCFPGALPEDVAWINDRPLRNASKPKDSDPQSARTAFTRLLRLQCAEEWLDAGVGGGDAEFEAHEVAVVRAELETGRRHQIRRHLANTKCPIIEDTTYGKGRHNRDARDRYGAKRLALHSRRLTFRPPVPDADGALVTIDAPVPEDLRSVLERIPGFDGTLHGTQCDLGHALESNAAAAMSV